MTITEADLRAALQRAADRADLALDPRPVAQAVPRSPAGPHWPRALAVAAVVLAVAALAAVARSGSQHVRTDRGSETTAPGPTATTPVSTEVSGTAPPAPETVTVRVLNGSGTSSYAADLTDQLAGAGYRTLPADNAIDGVDPTRVYFAAGQETAAQDLAVRIAADETAPLPVRPLGLQDDDAADLVVVVGRGWTPRALVVPEPDRTYTTTTTAPPSADSPPFVLWAGTEEDAAQRSTPEGALRALMAAVDPAITVDDVTVTAGAHSGWRTVTARIGGTVYVEASTAPSGDAWVISGLDDADHRDLNATGGLGSDGRLVLGAPAGTTTAVVYDLGLDPIRPDRFPEPGTETTLDQVPDQPSTGFAFTGRLPTGLADHLVIGRDASGAITTVRAFKIGP